MEEQLKWFLKSAEFHSYLDLSKAKWIAYSSFIDRYLKNFNDIVVYKGFWSGYELYEKPYYRFIADVDFFVDGYNYEKLKEFFLDLNFKNFSQFSNKIPKTLRYIFEYEMGFKKNLLFFEIHRKIFPSYYIEIDSKKLFKRAVHWKFNLLTFPIEEQFIISVLHYHKSAKKNLYWLWDIAILHSKVDFSRISEVCKFYSIDYKRFIEILDEIKMGSCLMQNRFFKKNASNYLKFFTFKALEKLSQYFIKDSHKNNTNHYRN